MKPPVSPETYSTLVAAARQAAQHSYSPYSRFRVGAAILTERGLFTGANVENASIGLCLCAERSALASAISAGAQDIRALAVSCVDAPDDAESGSKMPCGACRQWIAELAPSALILVDGVEEVFTSDELLPRAFQFRRVGDD